mgnify:CR=1 FL=1
MEEDFRPEDQKMQQKFLLHSSMITPDIGLISLFLLMKKVSNILGYFLEQFQRIFRQQGWIRVQATTQQNTSYQIPAFEQPRSCIVRGCKMYLFREN